MQNMTISCVSANSTNIALLGNNMVSLYRIIIMIAALWASYLPGFYGILFAYGMHWSAIVDFLIVTSCLILAVSTFARIPVVVWSICLTILAIATVSGLVFHFRDSGESGPLPFEWLNGYLKNGLPLPIFCTIYRILQKRIIAQQTLAPEPKNTGATRKNGSVPSCAARPR